MSSHKPPRLSFELLSDEDLDHFTIHSQKEIQFILKAIAKEGSQVVLYYGNRETFVLTTMVDADRGGLWLEASQSDKNNSLILNSKKFYVVSVHKDVKVQFESNSIETDTYDGMATFYMPLPLTLQRIQRRDHFRLATPIANPLQCAIPLPNPDGSESYHEFPIIDISNGGIALQCSADDYRLKEGKTYEDCEILLPDDVIIDTTLQIRNEFKVTKANGEHAKRVGCQFVNMDGRTAMILQRYITQLQLQQHSLK